MICDMCHKKEAIIYVEQTNRLGVKKINLLYRRHNIKPRREKNNELNEFKRIICCTLKKMHKSVITNQNE